MLDFRTMTLDDYTWMKCLQEKSRQYSCEYLPGNIYLWGNLYGTKICRLDNDFFATFSEIKKSYCFPVGCGDYQNALEMLRYDAKERNIAFRIFGVLEHNHRLLDELYPCCFTFKRVPEAEDYVYNTCALINLPGKKYHQKRNHIAAFLRSHSWCYEPLNEQNIEACMAFQKRWFRINEAKNPKELARENEVVLAALHNFFALGFIGGILYADGEIAGFTLGERINNQIFCTHIEKADSNIRGAYPMLNQQFAQNALSGYCCINREEDMGDEGLRRAKLSYHPAEQIRKYMAVMN